MSRPRLAVVGDALADVDLLGSVRRLCPDAPVPVLEESEVLLRPGGAALAALLAARSGAAVTLVTALGADPAGRSVRDALEAADVELVDLGLDGPTPEKVRIRSAGQSLLRVDRGGAPSPSVGRGFVSRMARVLDRSDAVLVADYGRGMAAIPQLRDALGRRRAPLVWDPHLRGPRPLRGTTVVTPNLTELEQRTPGAGPMGEVDSPWAAAAGRAMDLARRWDVGAVAVTMGERGVLLARRDGAPCAVPVGAVAGDPCGAGDAFAAALAAALAADLVLSEAVERAAAAATGFVAAGGATALARPVRPGIHPLGSAPPEPSAGVQRPPVVVAAGGCFDLLHPGHVGLLTRAASLGDRLVVLLNSDRSVRRLKGAGRPIQPEADRRAVLLALAAVDDVVVFDEDTPSRALRHLRPALFVKGGDYGGVQLPEAAELQRWGGQVVTVPYLPERSTTRLAERLPQEAHHGT